MDLNHRTERAQTLLDSRSRDDHDLLGHLATRTNLEDAARNVEALVAFIEARKDCSDFKAHVLLRAWRLFQAQGLLPAALWERVKRTLLDLPYRDFPADNRMLHRSENHRLCFLTAELLTAETWGEEIFGHTKRPAAEHFQQARNDLIDWTQWVGTYGSGEWDSSTYYAIDFLSLLDIFDFSAHEPLRCRAQWVLDKLILDLALKTFAGVYGGTQGRCYANTVLNPLRGPLANVLPYFFGVGSLCPDSDGLLNSILAMTAYRPPRALGAVAEFAQPMTHRQRQRSDDRYYPPPDVPHVKNLNLYSDINTLTHRTAHGMLASAQDYRPGEDGKQIQAWQATLSASALVFTNHPLEEVSSGRRPPGFWTGSGRLPRIYQQEGTLAALYHLRPEDRLPYSHAYFPRRAFDEVLHGADWIAGRVGDAYVGLRCTTPIAATEAGPWADCELRAERGAAAWVCELSSRGSAGSLDAFARSLAGARLSLDRAELALVYRSPQAGEICMGWTGEIRVAGTAVPLGHFPQHQGPCATGAFGSGVTEVHASGCTARLALETAVRTEA